MPAIMSDNDVHGQFQVLLRICKSEPWSDVWTELAVEVESFAGLGIAQDTNDRDVWLACQQRQIVLITGNRNADGPNSLEATIHSLGTPTSLPVLTIADPQSVLTTPAYAERVAATMLEYLFDLERLRGTGRLYLP